jgi:hypothetical protein
MYPTRSHSLSLVTSLVTFTKRWIMESCAWKRSHSVPQTPSYCQAG